MGADAKRFQEIADKNFSDMKKAGLALLGGTLAAGIGIGTGICCYNYSKWEHTLSI